jgi:DNA-directed RNA polymerase specialized sigma24 family protein
MSAEATDQHASQEMVRAAFRELHGPRLHGFALLLTLGNRPFAARLAADVLAEGTDRAFELRHPERAAAWLRSRVVHAARGPRWPRGRRRTAELTEGLAQMGVGEVALRGLSALGVRERAAVIASEIERLDPLDVAVVLDASPSRARRIASQARRQYLRAAAPAATLDMPGPLATRVLDSAHRAIS